MSTQPVTYLTPEQYLKIERSVEFRSEYIDGQTFAMSGGSRNHSRIISNTLSRLNEQLRGKACEVAGSDLRLHSAQFGIYTYPDIVVTCGPDQMLDNRKDTIGDATAIIEVLSPATQNYESRRQVSFLRVAAVFGGICCARAGCGSRRASC